MIDGPTIDRIQQIAQHFWSEQVTSDIFRQIAQGKEIGHRIADFVDDQTTALLTREFVTKQQRKYNGEIRMRSMGDIWLECDGIYHPVNIKSGVKGSEGQPNMVSLKKLLMALFTCQIDSYYLLPVKFDIGSVMQSSVFFIDMLDYLDHVTFDSGPGQIMLKARGFFDALDNGFIPEPLTVMQKVDKLMRLLEDGERRLIVNRKHVLDRFREQIEKYHKRSVHLVTPKTQESLNLA